MLWFGWLGFNAGSAFGANLRAVMAAWNSNLCAAMVSFIFIFSYRCSLQHDSLNSLVKLMMFLFLSSNQGGITWCLLDFRLERKYTMVGFCSGTIAGLVAATPSSGYIPPWASIILGIVTGIVCNYATKRELHPLIVF